MEYDVVILGGGFAGVECAKSLVRAVKNKLIKAVIVSDENYMVFQPMLPEVAGASISPRHVINAIRHLCPGIDVFKGEVTKINHASKSIHINAGFFSPNHEIHYQKIVFAMGAKIDLSRVPGMPEHALLMQNVGDAMRVRATVIQRFEEANINTNKETRKRLLTFVIVGGGYSGVETAAQVQDLMLEMNKHYHGVNETDFKVYLIHSRNQLLPTLSQKLGEYCKNKLTENGIQVLLEKRVKAVTSNTCTLDDDTIIPSSTIISTIGNSPHPIINSFCEENNLPLKKGRIVTNERLQVSEDGIIWAAGDCAAVPLYKTDDDCPGNAQFAMRQGKLLGNNILALINGKRLKPFRFRGLGELATIGHHSAVASIMGIRFSGFFAWWLWRTIYLSKLPGLKRKIEIVVDWTMEIFFARDINLLNPRYSTMLKTVNLERGDILFRPGEPAFSVYFVKKGSINIWDGDYLIKCVQEGEYFGERAILNEGIYKYQAIASDSATLVSLGAEEFKQLIEGSSALRRMFNRSSSSYMDHKNIEELKQKIDSIILDSPIKEIMTPHPTCLRLEMTISETIEIFKKNRHGSYPVIDQNNTYLGIIMRDDLYDFLKNGLHNPSERISSIPRYQLPTILVSRKGSDALNSLIHSSKNKLIVVNEQTQICGILTTSDLFTIA